MILRLVEWLARIMALLGGIVLTALVVLTCVSVIGRGANTLGHSEWLAAIAPAVADFLTHFGPVKGDFEVVEAGIAFSIFAFLPICQLHGGHATVDVFTNLLPKSVNRFIVAFWEVALTALLIVIAWRLYEGLLGKVRNGETTFLLQFPIWWAYAASFAGAVAAVIIGVYCAFARIVGLITGGHHMPSSEGAAH
ncbi:TRAP transporter small permease subunit [Oricola sp.]|uniref:TRAP transporter small permease n=1 Tax=Oricola sp. TaxID=1979950 RepID=UPI00260126E0|nr:TRAP transporter small permease subunit [Oricola sp.]MCI5075110.1 TRAP transporter small permease [Oricola sp.]